jgi:hypothetical protein
MKLAKIVFSVGVAGFLAAIAMTPSVKFAASAEKEVDNEKYVDENKKVISKFECQQIGDKYVTVVIPPTPSQPVVPMIAWEYNGFDGYPPQKRCQIVSQKMQTFYQEGRLNLITHGWVTPKPLPGQSEEQVPMRVLCGVTNEQQPCNAASMIYTLQPDHDPLAKIEGLNDFRNNLRTDVIYESNGRSYVNVVKYVRASASKLNGSISSTSPGNRVNNIASPTKKPRLW